MNAKEIKSKVNALLEAGTPKSEVFQQLKGQGVKDRKLAYSIAAHPNKYACELHAKKVNVIITIMFIQALIVALLGYLIGVHYSLTAAWMWAGVLALIPLAFAYGFYNNYVGAYNAYILISIAQFHKMFDGFMSSPISSSIAIAISISIIGFIWYVRHLLFPDFAFISPQKVKGQYVFSN